VLVYIARRLLYSIPVLFLSTFLSFTFVSLAGDPVAKLRGNPRLPASTVHNIIIQNHLNRSIPVRYWFWLEDVVTHKLGQLNPLRRAAQPVELARVALFLASGESSYVNGQAIVVDGGLSSSHPVTRQSMGKTAA